MKTRIKEMYPALLGILIGNCLFLPLLGIQTLIYGFILTILAGVISVGLISLKDIISNTLAARAAQSRQLGCQCDICQELQK